MQVRLGTRSVRWGFWGRASGDLWSWGIVVDDRRGGYGEESDQRGPNFVGNRTKRGRNGGRNFRVQV